MVDVSTFMIETDGDRQKGNKEGDKGDGSLMCNFQVILLILLHDLVVIFQLI